MKKYIQLTCLFLLTCSINGFTQTFRWTKDIKSYGFEEGYDLVVDPFGNVYVAGMMEYMTDFGNNFIYESAGRHDIYLAKYDSTGNLIWAKRAGGKGGDKIQSIAYDPHGFIYAVGEYEDTAYWENIMLTTAGDEINNMFIAKYDTSGSVLWVRNVNTSSPLHTRGYGASCDSAGNIYACGGAKGDVSYQGTFLFSSAGDYDGTLFKFDPNGNFLWARIMGGADSDKAYGVLADNNGSVYVTGYFAGYAEFSSTASLNGLGHTDIFLAKYDDAGTLLWVKEAGDTGFDRGWDIAQNINGEILITGECQAHAAFGSHSISARGNEEMFLASYDSNGNALWALSGGGVEDDIGRGVTTDNAGNIYVAGDYGGAAIFAPDSVTGNGLADIFFACYDITGSNLKWVRTAGGPDNDRGRGVGCDLAGNIYFCGEFVDSTQFDNTNLIGDSLLDVFVTRISLGDFCSSQISATTSIDCNGSCNGTASANAFGQGAINYTWSTSPIQTGAIATSLCAGTYLVTATDANGCSATATVTLLDPPAMMMSSTILNDISCPATCTGSASTLAIGQGAISYTWLTTPVQTGPVATSLCAGVYPVIAMDASGCSISTTITLVDPPVIQVSGTTVNTSCIGCTNGSITVAVIGGNGNYSYSWSNGLNTQNISGLAAGTYSVCVSDTNGCSVCDSYSVIDQPTGIFNPAENNSISIQPNPLTDFAIIKTPYFDKSDVFLYNAIGELVYSTVITGSEFTLSAENLEDGIYFLQVINNKNMNQVKIVVFHN